jgi:type IV secretory pathway VirD2 relaxase
VPVRAANPQFLWVLPALGPIFVSDEAEFRPRVGRLKPRGPPKSFVGQVLAAAQLGGYVGATFRRPGSNQRAGIGRGRGAAASWRATNRLLGERGRRVIVKARVVRQHFAAGQLRAHLSYLKREGVTRDGTPARMFDATNEDADTRAFAERARDDRHHFRFIVSPEDAAELTDLHAFTRDLVGEMEHDLGTQLDWVALDHWNTDNPHVHLIVRGVAEDGSDLIIHRDYISRGMRARAEHLTTLELGPRPEQEIRSKLAGEVDADRWTRLDAAIKRDAGADGMVDLRPDAAQAHDGFIRNLMIGRLQKLERMGLARPIGPAQWSLVQDAELKLRELGIRGDIIKTMHRAMTAGGAERAMADYVIAPPQDAASVTGRVVEKGLDDELAGKPYLIVDGVDGKAHYLRLQSVTMIEDVPVDGIVTVGPSGREPDLSKHAAIGVRVRSRLPLGRQVAATGATWLDRELVSSDKTELSYGGFGMAVREALEKRAAHLVEEGLVHRRGNRITFVQNLLDTLTRRELGQVETATAAETGFEFRRLDDGDRFDGVYRRRLDLVSGRYALIDDGKQFMLVPWRPAVERELGREVSGLIRPGGGVSWMIGRDRGPSVG